jgi:HEAT repeat
VLLPLVEDLAHDPEPEIRAAAVTQIGALGVWPASVLLPYPMLPLCNSTQLCSCLVLRTTRHCCASPCLCTGAALHDKETERSLRDIEASLLVTAAQCVLDDEDEVGGWALAHAQLIGVAEHPTHMLA